VQDRLALAAAIHPIEHQAMQMNVQVSRRAEALDERERTAMSLAALTVPIAGSEMWQ